MNYCKPDYPARLIPPFAGYTEFTPAIPKMYFDVRSQEQRIKNIYDLLGKIICYVDMLGDTENETQEELKQLIADFEKFKETGFLDYYEEQLEAWINENMQAIIEKAMKMVFFGLTLDGYFTAYIPDSWNEIQFDTVANYENENYGRLILSMIVDDTFQVADQPNLD